MNSYAFKDMTLGLTERFTTEITQKKMDLFYELSGDNSPIHVNENYAKKRGFNSKVCYGMLGASLLSTLVGVYLPGENCFLHSVEAKFAKPIFIGDVLTIKGVVYKINETFGEITIKASITNQNGKKVTRALIRVSVAK